MQAIGLGWIAVIVAPDVAYPALVAPLVLAGVGVSMAMPAAQNAVLSSVAVDRDGQGVRRLQHGPLSRRHVRHRALVAIFSANGAVDSPAHFSTGFAAAMMAGGRAVAAGSACGPVAAGARARCRRADAAERLTATTIGFRYRSIGKRGLDLTARMHYIIRCTETSETEVASHDRQRRQNPITW